jgi:hypothetical protein
MLVAADFKYNKDECLFQKPGGNMKLLGLSFTIIFFFATTGPLSADKVYTWTDKDGNLHITDQPPPEGANVRNVTTYKPQSEKEVLENQRQQQMRENAVDRKQKLEEAQKAELKAQKAAEEAKIARDKADAAVKDAKEYIDTHDRNQYMRRAYKYEMKKKASEADAAVDQANAAAEKARKAEEEAKRAKEELNNIHN